MALESGFFNSVNGDRKYNAEDISRYFDNILSSGVYKRIENSMLVSANSGMTLTVSPGAGLIDCHWFRAKAAETVTIPTANAVLPRFDTVVVRLDMSDSVRSITLDVVSGTPATSPVEPTPVRTETIHELVLALVYVPAGATSIVAENITDVRDNEWYCGYVHSLVDTPVLKMQTGTYRTTANDTSVIPINVAAYEPEVDIVNVYVNGFHRAQGIDYTIDKENKTIILTNAVDRNTIVAFEVYKPIHPDEVPTATETVLSLLDEVTALKTALSDKVSPVEPGVFYFDGSQIVPGYISANATRMYFSIPFNRPINSSAFTIQGMNVQVRQNGVYILGGASTWQDISDVLVSATISANGMLTIICEPSFMETPVNNAECVIFIEAAATIEFT